VKPDTSPRSSTFVLFNPSAGRGRCANRIDRFQELLRRHLEGFDHAATTRAGDEETLVDRALAEGYDRIVAVGGDGTWSKVADRIVRSGRRDVALGLLAGGTGNDFGKTFGITYDRSEEVVRAIASDRRLRIDVGRVGERHFLNVVGFGFDIAVIADSRNVPVLKGDALYRFCALRQLFRFPGLPLEISVDGEPSRRIDHLMLIVANARYFGGSFHIAPRADLHDGMLDLISIGNANPLTRARLFRQVASGEHETSDRVETLRGRKFRIGFDAPLEYEIDGEVYASGGAAVEIEAVPDALDLLVPDFSPTSG
jgi:diacylglycerol kinase (ATP)